MRVAILLPKLVNQGPVIVARDLIDVLVQKEIYVEVFYFDNYTELDFNCKTTRISWRKKISFNSFDVIHSHMLRPDFYIWLHRNKKDNPLFVSTLHQNIYDNLKASYNSFIALLFSKIWLIFLNKQDVVVTLTKAMLANYARSIKSELVTIYNGRKLIYSGDDFLPDDYLKIKDLKTKYNIIGTHCLLTNRKGVHQIIAALSLLPDFACVIVGVADENAILLITQLVESTLVPYGALPEY
jgi:hypothetical protein